MEYYSSTQLNRWSPVGIPLHHINCGLFHRVIRIILILMTILILRIIHRLIPCFMTIYLKAHDNYLREIWWTEDVGWLSLPPTVGFGWFRSVERRPAQAPRHVPQNAGLRWIFFHLILPHLRTSWGTKSSAKISTSGVHWRNTSSPNSDETQQRNAATSCCGETPVVVKRWFTSCSMPSPLLPRRQARRGYTLGAGVEQLRQNQQPEWLNHCHNTKFPAGAGWQVNRAHWAA